MTKTVYALAGHVALVTGGGRSIGHSIAVALGQSGAHVAVNYHRDADAAARTVAEIETLGCRAVAVQADVSDPQSVAAMLDRVETDLGPVEILVNNAGVLKRTPFLEIGLDEWEWILRTNLRGYFLVGQATARRMVARGIRGRIVNVSSLSAVNASPRLAHYSVSKAGITMLTRQMALELAEHGIRVNEVNPGLIETDMNRRDIADPAWRARRLGGIPLGRVGRPGDIAGAVLFLASEDTDLMTGASIYIDGGAGIA